MCGIIGFTWNDRDLAQRMLDVVKHRGPDGEGIYEDKNITLGHRRLAVIDLETGQQPMPNEDESIWVTCNGEIYNYQDLRRSLESLGHVFRSDSDTEVLVHGYEEWGHNCLQHLNGMFAFAIYDSVKKELFLARDRAGMKPLHYTFTPHGFMFASEIKSLLQCDAVKREMSPWGLHCIVNLRYIPKQDTMFKGIYRVPPGCYVTHSHSSSMPWLNEPYLKYLPYMGTPYWVPKLEPFPYDESAWCNLIRDHLFQSVSRHLISDVPVGVMLSGGIDSSTIVALASKMTDEPLKTFTMGFGGETDEINDARRVADHFDTDHHELIVDGSLLKDYPKMIWYADEPKRNLYPFYISQLVGQHVKVALGGLGSDELFGGYTFKYDFCDKVEKIKNSYTLKQQFVLAKYASNLIMVQTQVGDITDDEHLDYLETLANLHDDAKLYTICQTQDKVFDTKYLKNIYRSELYNQPEIHTIYEPYFSNNRTFIDNVQYTDFAIKLPDDFLLVDDRMMMAHSVESRSPFLDISLLNTAFRIPTSLKLKGGVGKYLLKQAMKDILPDEVLNKKKQGFAAGIYEPYRKEIKELVGSMVASGRLVEEGYIQPGYVIKVLDAPLNPKLTLHYGALWNILMAEMWYRIYIDGDVRNPSLDLRKVE